MTNNFNSSKSIVSICSCSLIIDHIYGRSKKMSTKETFSWEQRLVCDENGVLSE